MSASLSVGLSLCQSLCLPVSFFLCVCRTFCLSLCLSVCLSVCLPVSFSLCVCRPLCWSACLSLCLPVSLCVCLSACLSVCRPLCLSLCLSVCVCVSQNSSCMVGTIGLKLCVVLRNHSRKVWSQNITNLLLGMEEVLFLCSLQLSAILFSDEITCTCISHIPDDSTLMTTMINIQGCSVFLDNPKYPRYPAVLS